MNHPFLRTAKVVAVHRESNAVDLILMDGNRINDVPVLGFGGSNFGLAWLVAPTADKTNPNRKTYPGDDGSGRDLYAVIGQAEGSSFGTSGVFVLGFLYPMISEMMFAGDKHPDLLVFRHPSDVQVTIEKDGKTSVQHPAGARITIGTNYDAVNLEGQDFDELYRLRNNLGIKVGIRIKDTAESMITLDHEGNIDIKAPRDITAEAGRDITCTAGRDINATAERDIACEAKTRDITAKAFRDVKVEATTRDVKVKAGRDITADAGQDIQARAGADIDARAGGDVAAKAGGDVRVEAGNAINAIAGGSIQVRAGGAVIVRGQVILLN